MGYKDPDKQREYARAWRAANREVLAAKKRVYRKKYYAEHLEQERAKARAKAKRLRKQRTEYMRKWRKTALGYALTLTQSRKYYWTHRDECISKAKTYDAIHREERRSRARQRERRLSQLASLDADFYAWLRASKRAYNARCRGSKYRPRFNQRIPDWARKGEKIMDVNSQFLPENMTDSQRAYARELARERREHLESINAI